MPAWWLDAKFGVSLHWGLYSVPAFSVPDSGTALGEWYWNYIGNPPAAKPGNPIQEFHNRVYGSDFSYEKFADSFKAELYDPADWAKLFHRAGAKWAVLTSKHHDGFELWPSNRSTSPSGAPWNSVVAGPKRDLVGDFVSALRDEGLRAGLYHSIFEWFNPLYRGEHPQDYVDQKLIPDLREIVEKYMPDDIIVDGEWDKDSDFWKTKDFLAWLFTNSSVKDTVAVDDRWGNECRGKHGGYYVCENGAYSDFCGGTYGGFAHPTYDHPWVYWGTTCPVGSWGWSEAETYENFGTSDYFLRLLSSTVTDGGSLLLNVGPTHRGTIPAVQQGILLGIGKWLDINGEAIYETRARMPREQRREFDAGADFDAAVSGMNNVDGVKVGEDMPHVHFLGKVASAAACESACAQRPTCLSYTWHDQSTGDYAGLCYGRNDTQWTDTGLKPEAGHVSGRRS